MQSLLANVDNDDNDYVGANVSMVSIMVYDDNSKCFTDVGSGERSHSVLKDRDFTTRRLTYTTMMSEVMVAMMVVVVLVVVIMVGGFE